LRLLSGWLDTPAPRSSAGSPDPARRARLRIEAGAGRRRPSWWPFGRPMARPVRRSMLLAVVALLVVVAIVGAIGFGVPGIRIIFTGGPSPSPSPQTSAALPSSSPRATASPTAPGPPGSGLDLGFRTTMTEVPTLAGFAPALPTSETVGPPDTIWFREGRVSLVWAARPGLPETEAAGIGLLMTEFRGSVNEDFFQKMLGPDTTITPVTVGGGTGWWISGEPHDFLYVDARGETVFDSRRVVGDTLLWTRGDITFRMESSLGQAAAIALAETIR
ncbi:MAG TPA: hypothetical protein VFY18_07610, partial [Candidatus Limnocylindrales bacterium]|nr:hypothetical protein [Candidatus Limnocylindrales bacterium]